MRPPQILCQANYWRELILRGSPGTDPGVCDRPRCRKASRFGPQRVRRKEHRSYALGRPRWQQTYDGSATRGRGRPPPSRRHLVGRADRLRRTQFVIARSVLRGDLATGGAARIATRLPRCARNDTPYSLIHNSLYTPGTWAGDAIPDPGVSVAAPGAAPGGCRRRPGWSLRSPAPPLPGARPRARIRFQACRPSPAGRTRRSDR